MRKIKIFPLTRKIYISKKIEVNFQLKITILSLIIFIFLRATIVLAILVLIRTKIRNLYIIHALEYWNCWDLKLTETYSHTHTQKEGKTYTEKSFNMICS